MRHHDSLVCRVLNPLADCGFRVTSATWEMHGLRTPLNSEAVDLASRGSIPNQVGQNGRLHGRHDHEASPGAYCRQERSPSGDYSSLGRSQDVDG